MGTFEVGLSAFLHCDMATSLWGPGVECTGLKENSPKGSGTIRKCDFVGVGVAFWLKLNSLYTLGWIPDLPVFATRVLGFQVCTTTPGLAMSF